MLRKKKKIGEILVANGFITQQILDQALEHQKRTGGSITQHLISGGYIKEDDLARCISIQFGYPYLPLRAYDIPQDIVKMVPANLAQKYLLMPVDMISNIITLVMVDPLDEEAINEVEKATNCKVQSFVGVVSDIAKAIELYYGVKLEEKYTGKAGQEAPLFIGEKGYSGPERRRSPRVEANIEIHFPLQGLYEEAVTKDISMHGFRFGFKNILPLRSFLILEINIPKEFSPHPLAAVVQVVRVAPLKKEGFDIGVEIIDMPQESLKKLMQYALMMKK